MSVCVCVCCALSRWRAAMFVQMGQELANGRKIENTEKDSSIMNVELFIRKLWPFLFIVADCVQRRWRWRLLLLPPPPSSSPLLLSWFVFAVLCQRIENNDKEIEHEKLPTATKLRHIFGSHKERGLCSRYTLSVCHWYTGTRNTRQTCILTNLKRKKVYHSSTCSSSNNNNRRSNSKYLPLENWR